METRLPTDVQNTSLVVLDLTNIEWVSQQCELEDHTTMKSIETPDVDSQDGKDEL
jgi:hypothetical protein